MFMNMNPNKILAGRENGRKRVIVILKGLIRRLEEKRQELMAGAMPPPSTYYDSLNLHPRIRDVSRELFLDGYH